MKKIITVITFVCFGVFTSAAQQILLSDQYLVNKYALTPAMAGHNNNFESFLSVRKSWIGIEGAPSLKTVSINGPLMKYSGIGATITSQEAGIFRTFSASFAYAHQLKFSGDQSLRLGLSAGFFENQIDLSAIKSQQSASDPLAYQNQSQSGNTFDADFGMVYTMKKLSIGLVLPQIVETKIKDAANAQTLYTFKRHYILNVDYLYYIGRDFLLEPQALVRATAESPVFYEVAALAKYRQQFWLGGIYRKGNALAVIAGASLYNNFAISYSYGFSGGIQGSSSGTHEVTLGLYLGKNKNNPTSIFPSEPKIGEAYYHMAQ